MKRNAIGTYVLFVLIALAVGGLASWLTNQGMPAYEALRKPPFTPPAAVFPVVWTVLYVLMGLSAARVWRTEAPDRGRAIGLWALQLALNFLWTLWSFTLRWYLLAFLWLIGLVVVVALMVRAFLRIDRAAGWMQVPYLVWCCFATVLSGGVWWLN